MDERAGERYHLTRKADILAMFDDYARAWRPLLGGHHGEGLAAAVVEEARRRQETLIPAIPYIGGDENPMTRHLIRSTASLVLYQAMKAHGRTAEETGRVLYQAIEARVRRLPLLAPATPDEVTRKREQARESQERRYPGDWVWEFVEGDGREFEYGYDFTECGTQKLYQACGADGFLPFYCYLDFAAYRTAGWSFLRTMTLAEGRPKCDFRFRKGGRTKRGWPPPFAGR